MSEKTGHKLWGGRFEGQTDKEVEAFSSSLAIDYRLWKADVTASIAHGRMLGTKGILPQAEANALVQGLTDLLAEFEKSGLPVQPDAEDIHSEIERHLLARVGPIAGKLHTARSRNDQVITATRLTLRHEIDELQAELKGLQSEILKQAEPHLESVMPGLTHFQHAQPVSLAHHLLAYFWMLQRDRERLTDLRKRVNRLPLGSAALAGTPFPIDRQSVARELQFEGVCENSLDAVSDRDFIVEFLAAANLILSHLSKISDEFILWSSPEIGYVELDDSVTTGSSIMPQKKNPDVAELIRGKTGRLAGSLMGMLTVLKALPLAYNRDLQEDKVHLFEGVDTTRSCVRLATLMLSRARFKTERMAKSLEGDFSNATELADYLAKKGLPFRQAHDVVGKIVRECLQSGEKLEGLSLTQLSAHSKLFEKDILEALQHQTALYARTSEGGTSPQAVQTQILAARKALSN